MVPSAVKRKRSLFTREEPAHLLSGHILRPDIIHGRPHFWRCRLRKDLRWSLPAVYGGTWMGRGTEDAGSNPAAALSIHHRKESDEA